MVLTKDYFVFNLETKVWFLKRTDVKTLNNQDFTYFDVKASQIPLKNMFKSSDINGKHKVTILNVSYSNLDLIRNDKPILGHHSKK